MGVFVVAEFESVLQILGTPFLIALGPIFARKLGLTRERWELRTRGRVSRRILHQDEAFLRVFWNLPNSPKCNYYSKGILLAHFIEFVLF